LRQYSKQLEEGKIAMVTRRQFFVSSINLTAGFYACTLSAGASPLPGKFKDDFDVENHIKYRSYKIVRDMIIHKIIGNAPTSGRVISGHAWLYRRMNARKYIDKYYSDFGVLPGGEHNLSRSSSTSSSWVVDFNKITLEIRQNLARKDFADYPDWVGLGLGRDQLTVRNSAVSA
jgi:hypothetical protein